MLTFETWHALIVEVTLEQSRPPDTRFMCFCDAELLITQLEVSITLVIVVPQMKLRQFTVCYPLIRKPQGLT